jgi:hypothetical protein
MSLEEWVEYGWLKPEPTSPNEISGLVSIVERGVADSKVETISTDLRFIAAYNAVLTSATIALRASGYRTSSPTGHHLRTIESLEFTIGADSTLIGRLRVFNNKRNKSSYDVAGAVSTQELQSLLKVAGQLRTSVLAWLQERHPELLKS